MNNGDDLLDIEGTVLSIGNDNSISRIGLKEGVCVCSKLAVKSGFFKNLILFDSKSVKYLVNGYVIVKDNNFFSRYIFGKMRVRLIGRKIGVVPIDDIIAIISSYIRKEAEFWEAYDDVEKIIARVECAKTVDKIMKSMDIGDYLGYGDTGKRPLYSAVHVDRLN